MLTFRAAVLLLSATAAAALHAVPLPAHANVPAARARVSLNAFNEYNNLKSAEARRAARDAAAQGLDPATVLSEQVVTQETRDPSPVQPQTAAPAASPLSGSEQTAVRLAVETAVASASAVLRGGDGRISSAAVGRRLRTFRRSPCARAASAARPRRRPSAAAAPPPLQQPPPPPPAPAPPTEALMGVLTEFVESPYARKLCDECGVQPWSTPLPAAHRPDLRLRPPRRHAPPRAAPPRLSSGASGCSSNSSSTSARARARAAPLWGQVAAVDADDHPLRA